MYMDVKPNKQVGRYAVFFHRAVIGLVFIYFWGGRGTDTENILNPAFTTPVIVLHCLSLLFWHPNHLLDLLHRNGVDVAVIEESHLIADDNDKMQNKF